MRPEHNTIWYYDDELKNSLQTNEKALLQFVKDGKKILYVVLMTNNPQNSLNIPCHTTRHEIRFWLNKGWLKRINDGERKAYELAIRMSGGSKQ